ncbi:hypothetical protein [Frigoribacterium sp. UYMn621]|uniref:hypothetical protein n=1 Tax=Frigoribacterium sp. UYMn621 TaxID=3156343 RepID=UPI0033933DA3
MTTRILVHESDATLRAVEGNRWAATLISPGQGSSGVYSESVLRESAARAFPAGTKLWFGHPKAGQGPGERDPRDQWGFLPEDAQYQEGVGIVATPQVLDHWKAVVESLGTQAALSVFAIGESDEEGNVTSLLAEVTNSVDIVSYPGRSGSGLTQKLYEAARAASPKPAVEASAEDHMEEGNMDELTKAIEALTVLLTSHITESKAAVATAVEAEASAESVETAVESAVIAYGEKATLIDDAKLLPSQVAELKALALKGADVAPLIEKAKAILLEAKAASSTEVTLVGGRVLESAGSADDYQIGRYHA